MFQTNPIGGVREALVVNYDWNTAWDVRRSRRDEHGWTAEMAIPFKSLRYPHTASQIWGINISRDVRSKNENSILAPPPNTYGGPGIFNMSLASTLVEMEPPPASRNIELKPSLISSLTTKCTASPPRSNDIDRSFSADAKYGLTSSMTLDFTYNTDFAQVEIDEQQVNFTRFSLFCPEKRDLFLEGQSVFDFGLVVTQSGLSDTPIVFFTRRIGLDAGQPVPIRAGARLTGRATPFSIGV